ncbi:MAG: MFS transporter [Armatimonadetes bacterium]|nr:MFS transporter [Armatimonadota bacterium]
MFAALRHRNYRLYWSGILISAIGSWVQTIAQGWLVFKLTNSSLMLGTVLFLNSIPFTALSLFAGVIADRVDRRKLLLLTQSILALSAFILGVLITIGSIRIWHIMGLAFLSGCANAFDIPTRHSSIPFLVAKEHIMNAIALQSAAFNSARIIGPAIAGILVEHIGIGRCFFVNSVSFLAVIAALILIRIKSPKTAERADVLSEFRQGMRYVWEHSTIRTLIIMVAFPSVFSMPYTTLMPVFADRVLKVGVTGYGTLMSAVGIGALVGALNLAFFSNSQRKGLILSIASVSLAVMLILFANSKIFPLSLVFLVGLGFMNVTYLATTNTLVQSIVPDNLRGRVVSAYLFAFQGLLPLGHIQAGALANIIGAQATLTIGGIICGSAATLMLLCQPKVRSLK